MHLIINQLRYRSLLAQLISRAAKHLIFFSVILFSTASVAQLQCDSTRIEAEDYQTMSGVRTQSTSDSGGGLNVGWLDSQDWMAFEIDIKSGGTYEFSYRVARRAVNNAKLRLETNSGATLLGELDVPSTGGWQSWTTISHRVEIPADGLQSVAIAVEQGGWNINWFEFKALDCASTNCESFTIEAEDFANMSGIQVGGTGDTGGGSIVGYIDADDWLSYNPIELTASGAYVIEYRVASLNGGGQFQLERAGGSEILGVMDVPSTGGWDTWVNISQELTLPAGPISFGLKANSGGWNINRFIVTSKQCGTGPVTRNPDPQAITAQVASAAMGKGFNLGQMFESTQHPRTFASAREKIDAYYSRGFRNVRIPITWTETVGGSLLVNDAHVGDVNTSHPRLKVIEDVVDYALSLPGMYVVINVHHESTLKTQNRWWVLERLWQDIADVFKDRDHRLVYELINEPHQSDAQNSPMAPQDVRFMSAKAYDKIRQADPFRIIIIGGNQWFGAQELALTWDNLDDVGGGSDDYLMATFHHYNPWSFNGSNQGSYDDNWTDFDMENPMDVAQQWASGVGQGIPIYIGEWGVGWGSRYTTMDCNNIRRWYERFHIDNAAPKSQPTSVWDDGGWFKIFDHSTNEFDNNLIDCIDGSCAYTGSDRFNSACN